MKKPIILIIVFLLLSLTVFGAIYLDEVGIRTHIDKTSDYTMSIKDLKIKEDIVNLTLERHGTKINFYNIQNIKDFEYILFNDNLNYDSSAVTIDSKNDLVFDIATVTLTKNLNNTLYNSVLYSPDGLNFTQSDDIIIRQNNTHLWFNVTHFSSWTSTVQDIYMFHEILDGAGNKQSITFYFGEFATVDGVDCVGMTYYDPYNETTSTRTNCVGQSNANIQYSDDAFCFGDEIYRFDVNIDDTIDFYVHEDCDEYFDDGYSGDRFKIFDPEIGSGAIDLIIDDSFNHPDIVNNNADDIDDTSATLECTPDYDDLTKLHYYDYAVAGDKEINFSWKKSSDPTYTHDDGYSTSDGVTNTLPISGLDVGTQYTYYCEFDYYDLTNGNGGDWSTITSSIQSFSTTGGVTDPTVENAGSVRGDEHVYLKALTDFGTYIGGDISLAFNYSVKDADDWTKVPFAGYHAPSDGVVFTSNQIVNLTNGVEYEWFPYIVWATGNYTDVGGTGYFIPQDLSGGGGGGNPALETATKIYYTFDDNNTGDFINLVAGGPDGTCNGGVWATIDCPTYAPTFGWLNGSQFFVDSQTDEILIGANDFMDSGTDPHSICMMLRSYDWTYTSFYGQGAPDLPFSQAYVTTSGEIYWHVQYTDAGNRLSVVSDSNVVPVSGGTTKTFVCMVRDSVSTAKIYINGTDRTNTIVTVGTPTIVEDQFYIGSYGGAPYFEGHIDEFMYFDTNISFDDINFLYNESNPTLDLRYPYPGGEPINDTPTAITLSPSSIDYDSALLRGVSTFNSSIFVNTNATFELREVGAGSWLPAPPLQLITSDTVYTYEWGSLQANSNFEYRTYVGYNSSDGHNYVVIGNISYFNTTPIPQPNVSTETAVNVTSATAVLKGNINNLYGWNTTNIYFNFTEDGSGVWSQLSKASDSNLTGDIIYNISALTELTDYQYFFWVEYNNSISSGSLVEFSTSEFGSPLFNTLPATVILRDRATVTLELLDLGIHSSTYIYFHYYNTTHDFNTTPVEYTEVDIEISDILTGLNLNTTYYFEGMSLYAGNSLKSGGLLSFTTLSLLDYIQPTISSVIVTDTELTYTTALVYGVVTVYDANDTELYFKIFEDDGESLTLINTSPIQDIVVDGVYSYMFTNLSSDTDYAYVPYILYNNSVNLSYGEQQDFTTLDIVESPKFVTLLPNFEIWVEDPYFFMLTLIVCFNIAGFVGAFAVSRMTTMNTKLLIYMLGIGTLLLMIWGYMQDIYPVWPLIANLTITLALGFYYFSASRGDVSYG